MRVQCRSCGGVYETVQPGGARYFHACPPLSVVELAAAVEAGAVTLPDGETPDIAVARRTYERENKRDENRPSTNEEHAGKLKAEGDGVDELPAEAATATVVVPRSTRV